MVGSLLKDQTFLIQTYFAIETWMFNPALLEYKGEAKRTQQDHCADGFTLFNPSYSTADSTAQTVKS